MDWLATGIEQLVDACRRDPAEREFDVIVIGSGYGGSVMAARLARLQRPDGRPIRLAVLERGREYVPGEFPDDLGMLPGHVRIDRWDSPSPIGAADALFNFQINPDLSLLTGCALGGGSQINANVAIEASPGVLGGPGWPRVFREQPTLLAPYYERARRMLGITDYPGDTGKFRALREVAWPIARRFEAGTGRRGGDDGARFSRAPIAVTFAARGDRDRAARSGDARPDERPAVEQSPCIECGNCVSGCNHWAKNTLTMNYLPHARQWGARLVTGVTVTRLARANLDGERAGRDDEPRWHVQIDATIAETAPDRRLLIDGEPVRLVARRVIVAAGAVGSAELLLRSRRSPRRPDGLWLSPRLGEGLSTNGDMISAAYWQRERVDAVGFDARQSAAAAAGAANGSAPNATVPNAAAPNAGTPGATPEGTPRPVGPTITGLIDLRDAPRREDQVLIEDGAVPGALADLWAELLATASLPHQLTRWRFQARRWHGSLWRDLFGGLFGGRGRGGADGLLVSDEAARHSQLLLAMGHDAAAGVMRLREAAGDAADFRRARIDWREADGRRAADQPVFERQSDWLRGVASTGAIPLDNPLWKPLPDKLASTLADGKVTRGTLMTVHPLGGCRMADEAALGVVDPDGQVYDGDRGAAVHPGLYVCDGSIVPTSLGANPLLTISALAERQAERLIERMIRRDGYALRAPRELAPIARPADTMRQTTPEAVPAIAVPENAVRTDAVPVDAAELAGAASDDPRVGLRFRERLRNLTEIGLTLEGLKDVLAIDPASLPIDPAERKRLRLALDVQLDIDDLRAYLRAPHDGERAGLRARGALSIQYDASSLMPGQQVAIWRDHRVTLDDGEFRLFDEPAQSSLLALARGVWQFRKVRGRHASWYGGIELRKLWMYAKLCRQVGTRRRIDYRFRLTGKDGRDYVLDGRKHVEFADRINPWLSLADVAATIAPLDEAGHAGAPVWRDTMRLDPLHMLRHELPQVTRQPHAPAGILAMASYGLLFARALAATHLFHFREPDYEPATTPRRLLPGPLAGLDGPEHHWLTIDDPDDAGDDPPHPPLRICATRYRATTADDGAASGAAPAKAPIVIFHGILHSTLAFATDTIDENLTQHLCRQGYEVWLIDFRTSIAFGRSPQPLSFDRIARHDVPAAIDHVLAVSGARQVNVFAHCMGAAVFSMAMLGRDGDGRRYVDPARIRALCYCQVSFLVVNAYGNLLRAEAIALVRDGLNLRTINPRVDDSAGAAERLLDRIAFTYPVAPAERDAHDRHGHDARHDTAVCNRLNLLIGTHWFHHNLDPRTHQRLSELLGPSHVETFYQIHHFGLRGRVMNAFGENVYATDDNLREVFGQVPTLFIQGAESDVFDTRTTAAACERLQALTGVDRHRCRHYPGYGHLECVFGKDAARVVYPDVVAFFDAPPLAAPARPVIETRLKPAEVGPVIGAATPIGDDDPVAPGGLLLRIWYAPQTDSSDLTEGALVCVRERGEGPPPPLDAADFQPVTTARDTTAALTPYVVLEVPVAADRLGKDLRILLASKSLRNGRDPEPTAAGRPATLAAERRPKAFARASIRRARPATRIDSASTRRPPPVPARDANEAAAALPREPAAHAGSRWAAKVRTMAAGDPGLIAMPLAIRELSFLDARPLADASPRWTLQDPPERFVARSIELSAAQLRRLARPRPAGGTRLLLASCRHPGNFFESELSERIFTAMAGETRGERPIVAAVFAGDQIYADATANLGATRLPRERVTSLYAAAFKSPAARDLLRKVPCIMAGDDHEIVDNWAGARVGAGETAPRRDRKRWATLRQRATWAREAYEVFQWEFSEGARAARHFDPGRNRLWHEARLAGFACFVTDGRFERALDERTGQAERMLSPRQLAALLDWIDARPATAPCFIVTSAAPWPPTRALHANNAYLQRSDNWARYPREFHALLERIARRGLRNVVILCGDAHCSLSARVRYRFADTGWSGGFTVVQSSGLYTPYPFANDRNADYGVAPGRSRRFTHRHEARGAAIDFDWTVTGGTDRRSYAIVDVDETGPDRWQLSVSHRDENGDDAAAPSRWTMPF
ncbi:MAG: GMC oxidoreductase [Burkholderiaceae bacterium]